MLKKISVLVFMLLQIFAADCLLAQGQKVKTYGSNLHIKAPKQKKEELARKTHNWMQETLDKKQFSPRNIDVEDGVFQGVGSFTDPGGIVQYELSVFARNNSVQMVFDADYHKQNPETNAKVNDNYLRKKAQKHFQDLAKDLETYLKKNE
jgi:hypothetical protein